MPCNDYVYSEYRDNPEDKKKIAELEIQLCKARNLLLSIYVKYCKNEPLDVDEERAIEIEEKNHALHRQEDREDRLQVLRRNLEEKIGISERIIALGGNAGEGTEIFNEIKKISRHIAWIESLSYQQILYRRDIMDNVPDAFILTREVNPYTKLDIEKIYRRLKKQKRITSETDFETIKKLILIETNNGASPTIVDLVIKKIHS